MRTTLLCVLLVLVSVASAEVFTRCEWARILKSYGMDGYHGYSLANWVCLSQWESSFNTAATHHDSDGSTDYGIFQINSRYWCDDYQTPGAENVCGIACSELLTGDVSVAISCAKRVVQDSSNGIAAWMGWQQHCQWQDLSSYVADCDL